MAAQTTAERIAAGASAMRAGSDVGAAVAPGTDLGSGSVISADGGEVDSLVVTSADEDTSPLLSGSDQDMGTESTATTEGEEPAVTAAPTKGDVTTSTRKKLTVKGPNGARETIEVDYSNKEAIEKAHLMAHGARKWQQERDAAIKERDSLRSQHEPLAKHWSALEAAFSAKGIEGVVDLLEGTPGAYQKHLEAQIQHRDFIRNATPEEKAAYDAQEASRKQAAEIERIRKENEEFRSQVQKEREEAETRSLESKIHPAFEKYRFAGKLGSADDEHIFDEMLWTTALRRLEPYEDKGLEITPDIVEREFRTVAQAVRGRMSSQTAKATAKSVERKKEAATEHAQTKVRSGYVASDEAKDAMRHIQGGDLKSLFKDWGRLGKVFNK